MERPALPWLDRYIVLDCARSGGHQEPDTYQYDPLNPVRTHEGWAIWEFVNDMGSREDVQRRDDVLVYTSAAIEEAIEVTGAPTATLYAASTAPDTDFVVTLSVVFMILFILVD